MKKILFASCILLLGIICLQSCSNGTVNPNTAGPCDSCTTYPDTDAVPGMVDATFARQMSIDYYNDVSKRTVYLNGKPTNMADAGSVWVDLDQLKHYIRKIEKTLCTKGCNTSNLGMRFYYGKYPDAAKCSENGIPESYANKHTIFLVPTYTDGSSINKDFYYLFTETDPCRPMPFKEALNLDPQKGVAEVLLLGQGNNHGGLEPPFNNEDGRFGNN